MKLNILTIVVIVSINRAYATTLDNPNEKIASVDAVPCVPSVTTVSGTHAPDGPICQNTLLFNDDFNDLNLNLWQHERTMAGYNGEFNWYVNDRRNSFVQDGKLYIRPTFTEDVLNISDCHIIIDPCDTATFCEHICSYASPAPPLRSAKLKTIDTFAFKYGRVEIRAKPPTGDWLWPALWFMPKVNTYGAWPRSGEIDLFEYKGNEHLYNAEGENVGVEEYGSTIHFGNTGNSAWWTSYFSKFSSGGWGWNKEFHLYQFEWTPTYISFSVDNNWLGTIPAGEGFHARGNFDPPNIWADATIMAPFDHEFHFNINLAIGGTNGYFPDDGNLNGKPWRNNSPTPRRDFWDGRGQWLPTWKLHENNGLNVAFQIDYVRMWSV